MIPAETLEKSLETFPTEIPGTNFVVVDYDQYLVFRQATIALLDISRTQADSVTPNR